MEFDLVHNGVRSLVHGVELLAECAEHPDRLRFAMIAFVDGIELLLKAQLAQEHRVLIYQDMDRPLHLADFPTVLRRLQNVALYPMLARHTRRLLGLDLLRRNLRHMKGSLTTLQAAIVITDTLPFLDILMEHRFDVVVKDVFDDGSLWPTLLAMQDIARAARESADREVLAHLRAAREGGAWPQTCPVCLADYVVIDQPDKSESHCLYCQHTSQLMECLGCGTTLPEEELGLVTHRCAACMAAV
jgi:hypothetical protein